MEREFPNWDLQMNEQPFNLLLVDHDLIFRIGLRSWLEQFSDLQLVADVETGAEALQFLEERVRARNLVTPDGTRSGLESRPETSVSLVVLDLDIGHRDATQISGIELCQQLKAQYPGLPILLLSSPQTQAALTIAFQAGVEGYCPKGTAPAKLAMALRQVAAGQNYWTSEVLATLPAVEPGTSEAIPVTVPSRPLQSASPGSARASRPPGPLATVRRNLCLSGLRQIEVELADLNAQLTFSEISSWGRVFLVGRRRELLSARWLLRQFLPASAAQSEAVSPSQEPPEAGSAIPGTLHNRHFQQRLSSQGPSPAIPAPLDSGWSLPTAMPVDQSSTEVPGDNKALQSVLFDRTVAKLQTGLQNLTSTPLEIDVFRFEKKRDLLYIILREFEQLLDELRFSQVQPEQLPEKRSLLLRDLWQAAITEFFGKYYTLQLSNGREVAVVPVLLQDADIIQPAILNKIPQVVECLSHLLFQTPLQVDNRTCRVGSPEAMLRVEALLQNIVIRVANAVVQPLLNHFADVETIKQSFYDRRLLSTRDIERFRNDLSWKYRMENYIGEPRAIFESRYLLLVLEGRGIKTVSIYAPRREELSELTGIQLAVTLVLETRDAIAPRLRTAASFVGNGIVYLLTQVIGRGIGLIGRGVIEGIGSSWRESRFGRKQDQKK